MAVASTVAVPLTGGISAAQGAVELGGLMGTASAVSEKPSDGLAVGAYGGLWIDEQFGLRGRYVRNAFDPRRRTVADGVLITDDRTRTLITAEFVYAFWRGNRVRPLLGMALGRRTDHSKRRCEPVSCDVLQAETFEQVTSGIVNVSQVTGGLLGGVSVSPAPWLRMEALFSVHDWPGERITSVFAVTVGVVPWRSR